MCTLFRFTLLFQNMAFAPSYSGYCSPSISFNPKQRIDLKFQGWLCYGTARTRPNIEGHQGETSLLRAKSIKRITACFLTGKVLGYENVPSQVCMAQCFSTLWSFHNERVGVRPRNPFRRHMCFHNQLSTCWVNCLDWNATVTSCSFRRLSCFVVPLLVFLEINHG